MKNKLGTLCILLACGMSVSLTAAAQEGKGTDSRDKQPVPSLNDVNRDDQVREPAPPVNGLNRDLQTLPDRTRDPLTRDPLIVPGDVNRPANALPRTFEGRVTAKTADTVVINGKTYRINRQTRFDRNGTFDTVKVGDTVHGYLRGDGTVGTDMTISSLGMGALRDRRPVREQVNPGVVDPNVPAQDRLDPLNPRGVDPLNPRTVPEAPAPGVPVQPGGPAIPRSPGQSSPSIPRAPGTAPAAPSSPAPSAPK